jgi:hypothetical protein
MSLFLGSVGSGGASSLGGVGPPEGTGVQQLSCGLLVTCPSFLSTRPVLCPQVPHFLLTLRYKDFPTTRAGLHLSLGHSGSSCGNPELRQDHQAHHSPLLPTAILRTEFTASLFT